MAILLAIASGGTWAIGMTVAKPALQHIDVLSYILGRWALVVPLAVLYAVATGTLHFPSAVAVTLAALAGFIDSTLGGFFYLLAMERAPAYQTATLASTAPLWGVSTAILILGEPLRWQVFVAAALAVVGAYLLVGRRLRVREHVAGSLFALLTGFLWGFAETIPSKLALDAGISPAALLFVFSASSVVTMAALVPFLRRRFPVRINRTGIGLTVVAGVGGAFLGWLLWLSALQLAPASLLSPLRGSTLIFALVYSMLFLRERPSRSALLGVALVLGGVVLVSLVG
jgi:drug/metabolite transporter (DMT)-like permease